MNDQSTDGTSGGDDSCSTGDGPRLLLRLLPPLRILLLLLLLLPWASPSRAAARVGARCGADASSADVGCSADAQSGRRSPTAKESMLDRVIICSRLREGRSRWLSIDSAVIIRCGSHKFAEAKPERLKGATRKDHTPHWYIHHPVVRRSMGLEFAIHPT